MIEKIDRHILLFLSLFLLLFIPLFPKIPLFDALPGYAVRIRPEDFLIAFTACVWLREIFLGRVKIEKDFFILTALFAVSGFFTIILAVFLLQSIPPEPIHIGKAALHYFRYLEYFLMFFFISAAVKTRRHIVLAVAVITVTVIGVVGYGIGQKFWHLPVFSTMNREFSKGELLYLQEGARPQSTFAGHYDLGAYLVIVLPLLFSYSLALLRRHMGRKKLFAFLLLQTAYVGGVVMLLMSGAKTSMFAYAVAISIIFAVNISQLKKRSEKVFAVVGIAFLVVGFGILLLRVLPKSTKDRYLSQISFLSKDVRSVPSDFQGAPQDGVWSENALKYGLSMGIRLDTLWPQALLGFANNPLSGNGFGTLAMLDTGRFVETDSTDNNFLRTLGETGLIGFAVFYGAVWWVIHFASQKRLNSDWHVRGLSTGMIAAAVGLLINALYIDVFAASKVAFLFWGIAGLVYRATKLGVRSKREWPFFIHIRQLIRSHWPIALALLVAFFLLHQNPFADFSLTKDIHTFSQSLENLATARCLNAIGKFAVCRDDGFVVSNHFSLYAAILARFLIFFKVPTAYYLLNIILILVSLIFSYILMIRRKTPKLLQVFIMTGAVICFAAARFTQLPLSEPLFFMLLISPLLAVFLSKRLGGKGRQALVVLVLFLVLIRSNVVSEFQQRFAHNKPLAAQQALQVMDAFTNNLPQSPYFATSLNPLFVDAFGHGRYSLLPLTQVQKEAQGQNLWGDLGGEDIDSHLDELLKNKKEVYFSDFQMESQRFVELKQKFDPSYVFLGCSESCNIVQLHLEKEELSTDPVNFVGASQSLTGLSSAYSFSIINGRFDGRLIPENHTFNTVFFSSYVLESGHLDSNFLILGGDYLSGPDGGQDLYFRQAIIPVAQGPIIYNAGNFDSSPTKLRQQGYQSFFLHSEYFIVLDSQNSEITEAQKIQLYNSLMELEELPQMKNIIIVSHDLDWTDASENNEALRLLETELSRFPHLKKYYFTANHDLQQSTSPSWFQTKEKRDFQSYYFAGLVNGSPRDVSFVVNVTESGEVQVSARN